MLFLSQYLLGFTTLTIVIAHLVLAVVIDWLCQIPSARIGAPALGRRIVEPSVQQWVQPPLYVGWNLPVRCLGICQAPQQALYPPSWSPFAGRNRLGMVVAVVSGFSSPTARCPTVTVGIFGSCAPLFLRPLLCTPSSMEGPCAAHLDMSGWAIICACPLH